VVGVGIREPGRPVWGRVREDERVAIGVAVARLDIGFVSG
jgi:hypothetical protein